MSAVSPIAASLQREFTAEFGRTGPGTLGGRWMRQFWQPVLNSNELAPGKGPKKADCVASRVRAMFPRASGPLVVHRLDMQVVRGSRDRFVRTGHGEGRRPQVDPHRWVGVAVGGDDLDHQQ